MFGSENEEEHTDASQRRLPQPLPISAQAAVNPTAHILASFPVPQLAVPTPLPTSSVRTASAVPLAQSRENSSLEDGEGAAHQHSHEKQMDETRWTQGELKSLSRSVQESAAVLVQTNKFTRFLQEELHREAVSFGYADVKEEEGIPAVGARGRETLSTAEAAAELQDGVKETITNILTAAAHRRTIDEPTSLGRAKIESWTPAPGGTGMSLRPRIRQPINAPQPMPEKKGATGTSAPQNSAKPDDSTQLEEGRVAVAGTSSESDVTSARRSQLQRPTSPPPPHPLGCAVVSPKTSDIIDASFRDASREVLENTEAVVDDLVVLQQFNSLLPLYAEPFMGISVEKITKFLSVMSAPSEAPTSKDGSAGMASGSLPGKATPQKTAERAEWRNAIRGLSCLTAVTHATFPTDAVPDGLMDRLVGVFGSVVRRVGQVVTHAAPELSDMSGELSMPKSATLPRSGRRGYYGSGGMPAILAATSSTVDMPTALMWLELLRLYLQRFSLVICSSGVNLVPDGEMTRLEDSVFQSLFLTAHRSATKEGFLTYSSYVVDTAVQTYRCLWNRLEAQRYTCADNFFPRVLVSEYLPLRTYGAGDGKKLMPLTVAVLAAAQSTPLSHDAVGRAAVDRLFQQCDGWAHTLVEQFLLPHIRKGTEKAVQDTAWVVVTQLLEDLTELLGAPEWPAADLLLRSCVMKLAHVGLGGAHTGLRIVDARAGTTGVSPPPQSDLTGLDVGQLTGHVVDVVAHVAIRLFDPTATTLCGPDTLERFVSEAQLDTAMSREWADLMKVHTATPLPSGEEEEGGAKTQRRGSSNAGKRVTKGCKSHHSSRRVSSDDEVEKGSAQTHSRIDETEDITQRASNKMEALIYYALSRNAETRAAADVSAAWRHARAAHLLSWRRYRAGVVPEGCLDRLARATAVPCGGLEVEWERLRCWCRALASVEERSMLSAHMRHTLVTLLLAVFGGRDARGGEMAGSDVVVKKVLTHLTRLCDLHPPLLRQVWPIAQRCVHDDSARARESSVPILMTLLSRLVGGGNSRAHRPGAASGCATPTPDEEKRAGEIVSKLVHLLHDKSVAVVSRTIAALDSLLIDPQYRWLLGGGTGGAVLSVIQNNLLPLASPTAEKKHRADVTRHFLRRWAVTLVEGDASATGPFTQLAQELSTLTMLSAKEFPHEVTSEHPLVVLLRNVCQSVGGGAGVSDDANTTPSSATGLTASFTSAAATHRRRSKHAMEGQQLSHAMHSASRALWARYQSSSATCAEAVCSLATLHALSLACREWVEPLLEPLSHGLSLAQPNNQQVPRFGDANEQSDFVAGTLLQTCHIISAVLASPKVPTISLNHMSQQLNRVLSRYVGKLQSRVIVACIGALTAMITCGAKHRLSTTEVNHTYLQHCYQLMNGYYASVNNLLEGLGSNPQNLPYIQRFLFLLSEFLRQYTGWKNPVLTASLAQSPLTLGQHHHPHQPQQQQNLLAKGVGICGNVYSLVERVLAQCQNSDTRQRIVVIGLRVLSSLCMLEPTTYLYRCEPYLREALASADAATCIQGLSLIRDFLVDEDSRVDLAARLTDRLMSSGAAPGPSVKDSPLPAHKNALAKSTKSTKKARAGKGSRRRGRGKVAAEVTSSDEGDEGASSSQDGKGSHTDTGHELRQEDGFHAASGLAELQDQNSGMSTWLMQNFHGSIVELSLSGNERIRSLCLEILQAVAQGGLLPPVKYLDVVVALATDVNPTLRYKAIHLLTAHAERYEDIIASQMNRAVQRIFQLHHACGVNLLDSAYTKARSVFSNAECSVYAPTFSLFRKRNRENLLVTLTRFFYQDSKVVAWCREYFPVGRQESVEVPVDSVEGMLRSANPFTFLAHLAIATALCPFTSESGVASLMQHCRTGIDLNGQSSLDFVTALSVDTASAAIPPAALLPSLWKCVGVVLLAHMRRAVRLEYRLTTAKLQKYAASGIGGHATVPLHPREPYSNATAGLLVAVRAVVEQSSPLLLLLRQGPVEAQATIAKGIAFLKGELEAALMDDAGEELFRTSSGDSKAGSLPPSQALSVRKGKQTTASGAWKRGRATGEVGKAGTRASGRRPRMRKERTPGSSAGDSDGDDDGDGDQNDTSTTGGDSDSEGVEVISSGSSPLGSTTSDESDTTDEGTSDSGSDEEH